MIKKKSKRISIRKQRELKVPLWLVDGFNGILALMIYNFALYLSKVFHFGGIIFSKLEEASGYFYLNSATTFGLSKTLTISILIIVFVFSFVLGMIIGNFIRKHER